MGTHYRVVAGEDDELRGIWWGGKLLKKGISHGSVILISADIIDL